MNIKHIIKTSAFASFQQPYLGNILVVTPGKSYLIRKAIWFPCENYLQVHEKVK